MRDIKYIDIDSISDMIKKADNMRDEVMIKLFFATFARSNELRQLKVSDFNLNKGYVKFRSEVTKTKEPRVAVLPSYLIRDLKSYLKHHRLSENSEQCLFQSRQSKTISNKRIQQIIKGYASKVGINKVYGMSKDGRRLFTVTPHTLRHSAIIHALDKGIPQPLVMQQSGHLSLKSFQVYTRFSVEDRKRVFEEKQFYNL